MISEVYNEGFSFIGVLFIKVVGVVEFYGMNNFCW